MQKKIWMRGGKKKKQSLTHPDSPSKMHSVLTLKALHTSLSTLWLVYYT